MMFWSPGEDQVLAALSVRRCRSVRISWTSTFCTRSIGAGKVKLMPGRSVPR
jgi:hypothetical protein